MGMPPPPQMYGAPPPMHPGMMPHTGAAGPSGHHPYVGAPPLHPVQPHPQPQVGPTGKIKKVGLLRTAAGAKWVDPSLDEWPANDFRIFVGNLGTEVTDAVLATAFQRYPSFQRARVVMHRGTGKSRGFGFVSLGDAIEGARVLKEMQGKYIGNRPVQLKKSNWDERNITDRKTGKAVKREIEVRPDDNRPGKKVAKGFGVLHR